MFNQEKEVKVEMSNKGPNNNQASNFRMKMMMTVISDRKKFNRIKLLYTTYN